MCECLTFVHDFEFTFPIYITINDTDLPSNCKHFQIGLYIMILN